MLKQDLNAAIFKNGQNPHTLDEVKLFRTLIDVMNKRDFAFAKEYHKDKGFVLHKLQYAHKSPAIRCCEIADVLMLFIDDDGNMRYTFLQNKRDKKIKYSPASPLNRVKADPVQWDLLHYRCALEDSLKTGLPKDCLSSAILNSAATYGIFVNDKSTPYVDMSYNIARDLTPVTPSEISAKKYNRTYNISTDYNKIYLNNGYWEISGTTTLDDFEMASQAMLIGTPIEFGNIRHTEFARLALSYAVTCMREKRAFRENEELDSLIYRCTERYRVQLMEDVFMPFNLVVIRAKKKYLITNKESYLSRNVKDCAIITDPKNVPERIYKNNPIVIIDSNILKLKTYLTQYPFNTDNLFVAESGGNGFECS